MRGTSLRMTFWRLEAGGQKLERRCAYLCGADGREVAKHARRAQHAVPLRMQKMRRHQFFGVAAEIFLRASSSSFASVQTS